MPKVLPFLPLFDAIDTSEPAQQSSANPPVPPDAAARAEALDIRRSFIVEAPAGSGKTGLLIQRFLKLLTDEAVETPEQVLAITFTLAATAEMRDRVIAHLEVANRSPAPATSNSFDLQTGELALAVLERDRQLGWSLLDQPYRLNIRTIDSVCAEIARTLPVLSGSGGRLTPAEDANPLHLEAARRTLLLLGNEDADFNSALRHLLLHRDGNLDDCEALIANMLSLRDQWGRLVPLSQSELDDGYLDTKVLPRLKRALDHAICSQLSRLEQVFPPNVLADLTALAAELGELPGHQGKPSPIAICAGRKQPPEAVAAHLEYWHALIHILLTGGKSWRKGFNVNHVRFEHEKHHKVQLKAIVDQLSLSENLLELLCTVRGLPPATYPPDQWAVAKSLFRVLSRALVELQLVFAAHNQCDFTELSLLARHALKEDSGAEDLASALGARLQHLLVDEMQDTSTGQYDLIEMLTKSWDGHSQTVFLVGDPRQSIYLFRQARVERFMRATRTGRLGILPLIRLQLTANFRSQLDLVTRFNEDFPLIFPPPVAADPYALPYTSADATLPASPDARALVWHPHPLPYVPRANIASVAGTSIFPTVAHLRHRQAVRDARRIRSVAQAWFAKPLPAGRTKPWTLAVLVRNRSHLAEIVAEFENEKFAKIPYRAVDITPLNERQEILDLIALTRAIVHPADRVATLAVLRAPWCGLSLAGLHMLTGADDPSAKRLSILRLVSQRRHLLPAESLPRVDKVQAVLNAAAAQRSRLTTAQLVERAWRSLGGDAWLSGTELTNTRRFFQLLDSLEYPSGIDPILLDERLKDLYAEPNFIPEGLPRVELLTMHKAKGLEWDVVFIPALERMPGTSRTRLLNWAEVGSPDDLDPDDQAAHIMLAPIPGRGEESKSLNSWLRRVEFARDAAERKRLFYVACTRARRELHLFATPETTKDGAINPHYLSLLKSAWPAAEPHFQLPLVDAQKKSAVPVDSPALHMAAAADWPRPMLERLPPTFDPDARFATASASKLPYGGPEPSPSAIEMQFLRPEGSFAARTFGNVIHACLDQFSDRIRKGTAASLLLAELPSWTARVTAMFRADGLPRPLVEQLTREAQTTLHTVLSDRDGLWLMQPHLRGDSELAITAWPDLHVTTPASIRIDRLFHAGAEPHIHGEDFLWIVDYKTSNQGTKGLDDFLNTQRATYGPQLEAYARILAPLRSVALAQVRLALYFPTLPRLLWWSAATG
ncbi:MAG: UvrD-helicase domain-containing protein [Acidobacteriota bacterium]|nr:UvrD-helicase domain-containing protein [Acidobacteriota bacterium]